MALEGCPWFTPGVLLPILTHDAYYAGDGAQCGEDAVVGVG